MSVPHYQSQVVIHVLDVFEENGYITNKLHTSVACSKCWWEA